MSISKRRYKVIASRDGVDLGHVEVLALDDADAVIEAFFDLQEHLQIDLHDIAFKLRADLDEPPTVN